MLEAPGGGGGTDWWGLDMETIHTFSQSPDIDAQYQIVDGWQKSAQLLGDHMGQVQDYHDALAQAWPPDKSTAAKTYLDRLSDLLTHLNETYEATLTNHDALSSATLSLSMAKTQVAQIYSEWTSNNKTLLAFNQQLTQKKQQAASGQPTPSPSPSGDEPPPVTASQQEALRQKAITLMSGVSTELSQAQLKVVRPAPYAPQEFANKTSGQGGSGTGNVPMLPPIVPASHPGGGGSTSGRSSVSSTGGSTTFPTTPGGTPATSGSSFPGGGGGNPGLVLGGANPPSTTLPPPSGLNPITSLPSGGGGSITGPGILPPGTGPFVPNGTSPITTGKIFPGEGGGFKSLGGGLPEGSLRAMPPGGIIGKTPGAGLDEPGVARFGTQRVNPIGGVIGEQGAGGVGGRGAGGLNGEGRIGRGSAGGRGGGRAGMRAADSERPYGQLSNRRAGRRDQTEDMHWDPDNPWSLKEGVDPVLLPAAEQRIDPGPAIGLG